MIEIKNGNKLKIKGPKFVTETLYKYEAENQSKIVFCYQNCSDLLWEKIDLVIEKNFWNSRLEAENLQKFWDH